MKQETIRETYHSSWFTRNGTRGRGKILIVEDDIQLQAALRDYLSDQGYEVHTAVNGAGGVREILKNEFRVIICDMHMPKFPGHMFYHAAVRVKPHLGPRFIFITADSTSSQIKRFIQSVDGIALFKPFPLRDLLDLVHQVEESSSGGRSSTVVPMRPRSLWGSDEIALEGIIREVNLDQRSFRLRVLSSRSKMLVSCFFDPTIEFQVIGLLGRRVRAQKDPHPSRGGGSIHILAIEDIGEVVEIEFAAAEAI